MIGSLRLVQNTGSTGKSAAQLIADEKCSAALDDTGEDTSLQSVDYSDTTWHCCSTAPKILCLPIRNCGRRLPASPGRMWMCPLPVCTPLPRVLCPPAFPWTASITASLPGTRCPPSPDPRTLYLNARQGMASSDFSGVTILLPKEAGLTELAEQINGAWQKDCSLFFSVEEVPQEEFDKRLAAGSYTIALAPIRAEGGSVYQMLQQFTAEGGGLTGWSDPIYLSVWLRVPSRPAAPLCLAGRL